jgi:hypothetical protein
LWIGSGAGEGESFEGFAERAMRREQWDVRTSFWLVGNEKEGEEMGWVSRGRELSIASGDVTGRSSSKVKMVMRYEERTEKVC